MNRFKTSKTSHWIATGVICPRCNKVTYAEYDNEDLDPLNVFACEREGCTFWDYYPEIISFYHESPSNASAVRKCITLADFFILRESFYNE